MRCIVPLLIAISCAGCTSSGPALELQPVKGRVLKNGQPVQGGAVVLKRANEQAILIVNGEVDGDGWFEPGTIQDNERRPGMPAGDYFVTYNPPLSTDQNVLPITLPAPVKIETATKEFTVDIGTPDD
jgi:hypothetical protein